MIMTGKAHLARRDISGQRDGDPASLGHKKESVARLKEPVFIGLSVCFNSSLLGPKPLILSNILFCVLNPVCRDEYTLHLPEECGPMAESH